MKNVYSRSFPLLTAMRFGPRRIDHLAGLGPLQQSRADIVRSGPHAWARLADTACMEGKVERAEELIDLAFLSYDMLGSDDCDPPIDFEDEEEPTDIQVTRSSVFA
jgi:hypothetical protein